jgi:hypothetical protein
LTINQRDIVEVPFNLPGGSLNHPAIVLSNSDAIRDEEAFVAIMLTSKKHDDLYSFEIRPGMLVKDFGKYSEARLHLIGFFSFDDVVRNNNLPNQIKVERFRDLIVRINQVTFQI